MTAVLSELDLTDLRALTVKQPYGWAIAFGGKTVENRTRNFRYRGPLAIHAGLGWLEYGRFDPAVLRAWAAYAATTGTAVEPLTRTAAPLDYGALVAVANLVDCHPANSCCQPWGQPSHHDPEGRLVTVHHLILADVRPVRVRCKGNRGLWRAGEHALAIHEQLTVPAVPA